MSLRFFAAGRWATIKRTSRDAWRVQYTGRTKRPTPKWRIQNAQALASLQIILAKSVKGVFSVQGYKILGLHLSDEAIFIGGGAAHSLMMSPRRDVRSLGGAHTTLSCSLVDLGALIRGAALSR